MGISRQATLINDNGFEFLEQYNDPDSVIVTDPMYNISWKDTERIIESAEFAGIKTVILFSGIDQNFDYENYCDDYQRCFWVKPISTKNTSKHYSNFVEYIHVLRWDGSTWNNDRHWSNYVNVFNDRVSAGLHPFEKPISLMERLIANHSKPTDTIVDPFCGSGSTLIASANLGRKSVGCEIDKDYYKGLIERMISRAVRFYEYSFRTQTYW